MLRNCGGAEQPQNSAEHAAHVRDTLRARAHEQITDARTARSRRMQTPRGQNEDTETPRVHNMRALKFAADTQTAPVGAFCQNAESELGTQRRRAASENVRFRTIHGNT